MNKSFWTKKAMALPVCAAIVVGGVALGATPAMANPADLSVTSQSVSGRVLTVNGTGTPGENIQLDASTSTRHAISTDGTWTITYTIPTGNDAAQTYTVRQTLPNGLNTDGTTTITAAPQVTPAFAINTHTVSGRTLTVTGTGTPGLTVQVDPPNGGVNRVRIGNDGSWTLTYQIPESAGTDTKTYTIFEQNNGFQTQAQGSFTAAAEATQAAFSVTSPKNGDDVASRTVTFTGTGQQGDTINLLDPNGDRLTGVVVVGADQTWTATVTFPNSAARAQAVRVTDVRGGSGAGDTTVNITLPAVAPASQFSLVTPKNGDTVDSRTVTFTGTGTPGDLVNTLNAAGDRVAPQVLVAADGTWTTTGTFSDSAPVVQNLSVNQVGGGQGQGTVDFTINLPAADTAPSTTPLTLITPKDGSTVDSRTVTFSGKGTPGDAIAVVNADGDVVAPAVLVGEDGTWTTTGTFSDSASTKQDLTVGEVDTDLNVVDTIDFSITLPAVATGTTPGAGTGTGTGTGTTPGTGTRPTGTLPVVAG
ncbi:hypothetical protein DEJ13_02670 [Curtobacterium sp. MCLR17_007]|uniref:hypothetical protein n=1 Tax=Curtobacterium sp. MCLR17_007 TaxID=2175648 RepID=UPI000DA9F9D4|nr:hypothetical protein [Curtobacterium sp. MCLR17_007]WIB60752.1 hypothetical protein DEJ13_02670 [Curtobacterium sp. MCLR17_007]